jgi:hypothetical protein
VKSYRFLLGIVIVVCVCLASYGGFLLIRNRAYAQVEQLTQQYAREVAPFVTEFAKKHDIDIVYFKVFEYEEVKAKVFVVQKQNPQEGKDIAGSFFYLKRSDSSSNWTLIGHPEAIWSLSGSADARTWPPYGPVDPFMKQDN